MKLLILITIILNISYASVVDEYLDSLKKKEQKINPSFKGFDSKRGEIIFTSKHIGKKGKEVSCVSCHTSNLNYTGENIFTGKKIEALSPKTNPKRFTKEKTIEKWLKRNFNDVYNREGTNLEKGDVVTYIINK